MIEFFDNAASFLIVKLFDIFK